jgi:hypothetical protein
MNADGGIVRVFLLAHFDDASKHEPATFIASYLLPPGEDRLIEML